VAQRDFPWLADVIPTVMNNVDQPSSDGMRATYDNPAEVVQHARLETEYLIQRISTLDELYNIALDSSLTVASGDSTLALPSDTRVVLEVYRIDDTGRRVEEMPLADQHGWHTFENTGQFAASYDPNANLLRFPFPAPEAMSIELIYEQYLPMPIHGIVQDAGPTTLQLGEHEMVDNDVYIGVETYIYAGAGAGQSLTATDYDGVTRTLTFGSSWATTPQGVTQSNTSYYTSRPPLPRESLNAFLEGLTLRLMGKLQEAVDLKRRPMLMEFLDQMEENLTRKPRKRIDAIRNYAQRTFSDPHDEVWAGYLPY
jgi:hypothetical protein